MMDFDATDFPKMRLHHKSRRHDFAGIVTLIKIKLSPAVKNDKFLSHQQNESALPFIDTCPCNFPLDASKKTIFDTQKIASENIQHHGSRKIM